VGALPPALARRAERELGEGEVGRLVDLLLRGSRGELREWIDQLRGEGFPPETIFLDLLAPGARRLGQMWESDECHFVDVTIALTRMQRELRRLSESLRPEAPPSTGARDAFFCCEGGKQHSFGVLMLSEFFLRAGWRVDLGAPVGRTPAEDRVASRTYDLVGISVACEVRVRALSGLIERLREASREPDLRVMVGGPAFTRRPELAESVGADATAPDAATALRVAEELTRS